MADKYQIDMCHGGLFGKIVLFSLPLMATFIIQLLFNAVNLVVIGHFSTHESMAAIGATMNLNSLVISLFIGLSVGSNVVAAKIYGSGDKDAMHKVVHTAMATAFFGGIIVMSIGLSAAKPLLVLMGTPENILPLSCTYIWICFAAIPFIMIYNFGCAILRAVGDTRRPLYFLIAAGIVNVASNLFLVIYCKMDVAGVAIGTATSHLICSTLIVITLCRSKEIYHLDLKKLKIHRDIFKDILKIGIPAGIQSSCFGSSNMIIQSSINTFGSLAIAGNTAALGLESIVYIGSFAFHQTAISFVAQNLGGKQFRRIRKSIFYATCCAIVCCILLGLGFLAAGNFLLSIFTPDPEVIRWGLIRMKILFSTYLLCGIMDVMTGSLRGLGYSTLSLFCCLFGACAFRIWWVLFIFPLHPTMENLMLSYPISWALVALSAAVLLGFLFRKTVRSQCRREVFWSKLGPGVPRGFRAIGSPK